MNKSELQKVVTSNLLAAIETHAGGKWTVFCKKVGIPKGTFKPWIDGESMPGAEHLAKLEKFGIPASELLGAATATSRAEKPPGPEGFILPHVGVVELSAGEMELLGKTLEVLRAEKTEGAFDQALKSSIEALHAAVKNAEGIEHKQPGSPRAKKAKKGAAKDAAI